ncbi:MAG TPA: bacteriocin fulvocin C-related protein [Ferruginibacter sp.]|nr:hypothetical protein [Chitinophagaceae bacterium]HRI23884.1 bacteriocin fulvocin C-related protein [Ferruginibacter sp.]
MKKLSIIVFLFVIGCSKQTPDMIPASEEPGKVISDFKLLSSFGDKRLAYNLLTSDEKYFIWKEHIIGVTNRGNFTAKQKSILETILGKLSAEVFKPGTKENVEMVNTFTNSPLKKQMHEYFTINERTLLFSGKGIFGEEGNNYVPEEPAPCLCNPDHNGIFLNDCPEAMPTCDNNLSNCTAQTYECGAFNLYTCNRGCR